jgi:hypothetical protein
MMCLQEMVSALKAVLAQPEGKVLATSTRLKPVYAALVSLGEACNTQQSPVGTPDIGDVTRARSVVDLLLEHSDLPANASYDDLITHAQESYRVMETHGGSSCDTLDCLLSPGDVSTASPCAFDPGSGRASSRHSGRRLVFTPTANLNCSPANCSPLSVFGSERADSSTPSAASRHWLGMSHGSTPALYGEGSSPLMASAGVSPRATEFPVVGTGLDMTGSVPVATLPRHGKALRVRTRIVEKD